MPSPDKHALLSASGAHRWLNCTAAPLYEAQFPATTSDFAQEGTLAHSICELLARMKFTSAGAEEADAELNALKANPLFKPEMLVTADVYVNYLTEVFNRFKGTPHVGLEVRVDLSDYIPDGFGTCDCIIIGDDTLQIVDYKHGQGVAVEAERNPQMMLYALGALKRYIPIFTIRRVAMAIVQPRITDEAKEYSLPVEELLDWGEKVVKPTAEKAYSGKGEFVPGGHCRFCRGKYVCPARAQCNTAFEDFKNCVTPDKARDPLNPEARKALGLPPVLTDAEVGDLLTRGAHLVEWYNDLKAYALQAALDGKRIPGYKLIEGRGTRVFRDTDTAIQTLIESGVDRALIYDYEPKTLAQLEKLIGKKRFTELVGGQVTKARGKPNLVEESDKREEYGSAAADFAGIQN